MGAEQTAKIESCVLTCLDHWRKSNWPFTRLAGFLENLKFHGWTDKETNEVQSRVNRVLCGGRTDQGDIGNRSTR